MKKDLLHCRMYKSSFGTRVEDVDGSGGGSASKARHAYRAIEMIQLPAEVLGSNVNYFYEPLYCAERCWAASMAVKAELNSGGGGGGKSSSVLMGDGGNVREKWSSGKLRAYSVKRLRKAVKFANLVESLTMSTVSPPTLVVEGEEDEVKEEKASPPVDEHTQMEARAYASWMRGNLALEANQWQVCARLVGLMRTSYCRMAFFIRAYFLLYVGRFLHLIVISTRRHAPSIRQLSTSVMHWQITPAVKTPTLMMATQYNSWNSLTSSQLVQPT